MKFVLGCILTSGSLVIIFRVLRLPVLPLITVNYWVCVAIGWLLEPMPAHIWNHISPANLAYLITLGALFIAVFSLTGKSAQNVGVGITGMVGKLSLVLPIAFAWIFLREPYQLTQVLGLGLGIAALFLLHQPYLRGFSLPLKEVLRYSVPLWVGNGVIDILFKSWQSQYGYLFPPLQVPATIMTIAGTLGIVLLAKRKEMHFFLQPRLWAGGVLLGSVNLASVYFYLKGLETLPAATFFLWNNLGIVLFLSTVGFLYYREPFNVYVGMGLLTASMALWIIS
ncbi:MAG: EamA family transporter [Bacteroidia bacterium]